MGVYVTSLSILCIFQPLIKADPSYNLPERCSLQNNTDNQSRGNQHKSSSHRRSWGSAGVGLFCHPVEVKAGLASLLDIVLSGSFVQESSPRHCLPLLVRLSDVIFPSPFITLVTENHQTLHFLILRFFEKGQMRKVPDVPGVDCLSIYRFIKL